VETKLAALYDLGQKLILVLDPQQIVEAVLDIAARVLALQDSDFLLVDRGREELYVAARRGLLQDAAGLRLPLDGEQGITVAAARSGQPIYVPDVRQDPRYVYTGFPAMSELAVPVQIEDRLLGVLNVESTQPNAFSQADQELLTILANQTALALENARLYADEHRQTEEMLVLNELSRRISANLDLEATLEAVVAAAAEMIPCALAEVSLWDEQTQLLTLQALRCEPDRTYPPGRTFPPGEGYTGWMMRHMQPLLVPDVDARDDIRPQLLPGEQPFKAYAGVPLLCGETLVGTLVLVANQAGAFGPGDMRLLQALANHAATAIRNARLYEEATCRHQELSAVYAVAEAVNHPGDLDQILQEGLKQALAVTGLEMGAIALRDKQDNRLALQCQQNMSPNLVAWLRQQLRIKSSERWPEGEDFQIEEIPLQAPHVPALLQEESIRLTADVPLLAEGELVGILSVASRQAHPFTPEERSLLRAIGHQLGTAVANARLRQEALAAERLAAVGRVATSVAHDLRSPLGGILRSAEFLARPELSPATRQKLSKAVVSLARRLLNTTQEILDYVRGEALPLRRGPCRLDEFLDEVLAVLEVDFSDRGIEVVRDCGYDGTVIMDPDRIAQVVYNIAANARDAMPNAGTFTVATRTDGVKVELRFTDTGPGVPEEFRDRIFEPFFSLGKRAGAGLGLSIARRIVEEHGGRLWLESREGSGATFVVSLPL
jgi:GAF domain-containing protein